MEKERLKVLVWGYTALNVGDDYFFDILFRRYPEVEFYFFPPSCLLTKYQKLLGSYKNVILYQDNPEYLRIRSEIPDESVAINLFPIVCACAKEMDAFINIGGSIFIEAPNFKNDDRYILKDIMKDKPCFIVGCNFGPGSPQYRDYLFQWFQGFEDVCFRDQKSYQLFRENKNCRVADDIVLITKKNKKKHRSNRIVGISVIDLSIRKDLAAFEEDYIHYHIEKVRKYIEIGKRIIFFSFCSQDGDINMIRLIINRLSDDERRKVKVCEYQGDLNKFLRIYKKCGLIIGSRLHSILIAITNNQDFIPISYSQKLDSLLKQMDSRIEILKIDGKMGQNWQQEKIYNMSECEFNSELQFKKIDQYVEGALKR